MRLIALFLVLWMPLAQAAPTKVRPQNPIEDEEAMEPEEEFPRDSLLHYLKYLLYQKEGRQDKALTELVLAYQSNPQAHDLLTPIVAMALDMKLLEVARIYAHRAITAAPNDPKSLLVSAQVMEAEGNAQEALNLLRRAYRIEPANPEVLLELAAIHAELGHRKEAGKYMDLYLGVAPGSPELLKLKASYELQDKNPKALESYKQAFEMAPDDTEILDGLTAAFTIFSTTEALVGLLKEALEKDPENIMPALRICQLGTDAAERRNCYEQFLLTRPNTPAAVMGLLETYEQEERWEEALDVLLEKKEAFGSDPSPYLKESFYLLRLGRDDEALGALERGAKEYPQNDSVAYFLALGYQDLGRWKDSKAQLERIYTRYPQWKEPAYNYALACGELGETALMEKALTNLWKEYPNDPVVLNALGYTWAEQGKDLVQAKALIEKAMHQEPGNPSYLDSLGWVYFKMGEKDKAYETLKSAAEKIYDPEVLIHLAYVLAARSDQTRACEAYLSARFLLASRGIPGLRLQNQLAQLEKTLNAAARPEVRQVLSKHLTPLKEPLAFRCDWEIPRTPKFRSKMLVRRSDHGAPVQPFIWPPGGFEAMSTEDLAHMYPQAEKLLGDFSEGLSDFFVRRNWSVDSPATTVRRWKLKDDYSVRFDGKNVSLGFGQFYSLGGAELAPRQIQLQGSGVKGTCEAMPLE